MPKKSTPIKSDFETAFKELEKLVDRMERGEQPLDESLKDFERGMELTRICQKNLKDAEQRVEKLVKKNADFGTEPFTHED